jgi:predicted NBD/HSP70 family sugar kinase
MRHAKNTKSDGRRHNRELVLRAIYSGQASNRAALAQETGLTKPTISDIVAELIAEGLVEEGGLGESRESGGKRPRLLRFLPDAQQIIGLSITPSYISGVLTNLNRQVATEHYIELSETRSDEVLPIIIEAINGLVAQADAPLRAIGLGISAVIDEVGTVQYALQFAWHGVPLAQLLGEHYRVPVHVANSTELAARAQFNHYALKNNPRLLSLLIGTRVGIGMVLGDSAYHIGKEIGYMRSDKGSLDDRLGWEAVKARAAELAALHASEWLSRADLSYLYIRYAAYLGDPAALALEAELSAEVADIITWAIAIIRPTHITLAGAMANLGPFFLAQVVAKLQENTLADWVTGIHFSVDESDQLVAIGAVAKVIEAELGLI